MLGIGTQFPDLIDKPFTWTFAILPSGRSVTHSLVIMAIASIPLLMLAERRRMLNLVLPFMGGWMTHLLGDSYGYFLGFNKCASYLLYPITGVCDYPENHTFLEFFLTLDLTSRLSFAR